MIYRNTKCAHGLGFFFLLLYLLGCRYEWFMKELTSIDGILAGPLSAIGRWVRSGAGYPNCFSLARWFTCGAHCLSNVATKLDWPAVGYWNNTPECGVNCDFDSCGGRNKYRQCTDCTVVHLRYLGRGRGGWIYRERLRCRVIFPRSRNIKAWLPDSLLDLFCGLTLMGFCWIQISNY